MTPAEVSQAIETYVDGCKALRDAVAGLDQGALTARPIPGRWSTLEVVCHLADSEQAWCHRMKRVIAEDRPLLIGYDETRFTAALDYHHRPVEAELALFEANRLQMAAQLRRIPAEAWDRLGVHSERGLVSLAEMVAIETEHVLHHIRTIEAKREALGLPSGRPA